MSRNYKFHNPEGVYFVSSAVVEWIDSVSTEQAVFTRNEYKDILLDSLRFCQKEKGMEIFAWVAPVLDSYRDIGRVIMFI